MSKVWTKYQEKLLAESRDKPYLLPMHIIDGLDLAAPYVKLFEHIIKKHAANVIAGRSSDFREQIKQAIEQVQQESYARGVKTANKIIEL